MARTWTEAALTKTFKVSRDKNFAAKVEDVVGLYLVLRRPLCSASMKRAKSKLLDRTQPGLPMKKGRRHHDHDYKRNGTTTLFAALDMLDGKVIGMCMPHHRHREFLRFLKLIDHQTPSDLDLHLIVGHLCHPQNPLGQALAQGASSLPSGLHTDVGFLGETSVRVTTLVIGRQGDTGTTHQPQHQNMQQIIKLLLCGQQVADTGCRLVGTAGNSVNGRIGVILC